MQIKFQSLEQLSFKKCKGMGEPRAPLSGRVSASPGTSKQRQPEGPDDALPCSGTTGVGERT